MVSVEPPPSQLSNKWSFCLTSRAFDFHLPLFNHHQFSQRSTTCGHVQRILMIRLWSCDGRIIVSYWSLESANVFKTSATEEWFLGILQSHIIQNESSDWRSLLIHTPSFCFIRRVLMIHDLPLLWLGIYFLCDFSRLTTLLLQTIITWKSLFFIIYHIEYLFANEYF